AIWIEGGPNAGASAEAAPVVAWRGELATKAIRSQAAGLEHNPFDVAPVPGELPTQSLGPGQWQVTRCPATTSRASRLDRGRAKVWLGKTKRGASVTIPC